MDGRPPTRIETERLVIRQWRVADTRRLNDAIADNLEHLRPWLPWIAAEPLGMQQRRRLLAGWERAWHEGTDFPLGVFSKDETAVLGSTGLHVRGGRGTLEIGYWIAEDHQGVGLATEVAGALTGGAFAVAGVGSVLIRHDRANGASAAVPRKLGYVWEGDEDSERSAPAETGVTCRWRMTRDRWADLRRPADQGTSRTRPNA